MTARWIIPSLLSAMLAAALGASGVRHLDLGVVLALGMLVGAAYAWGERWWDGRREGGG